MSLSCRGTTIAYDPSRSYHHNPVDPKTMAGGQPILVVFEDGQWREECVRYALELAKRLHGPLWVLMLSSPENEDPAGVSDLRESLASVGMEEGIETKVEVRMGHKASALLKFLASSPTIQTLVWGGAEASLAAGLPKNRRHWLHRIRAQISCPIVTAEKRSAG